MALGLVIEPAAVMKGIPALAAASTASSSAVAEPGIEVMIEHFLSMKARIWLICWLGSLFESDTSKLDTVPSAMRPSTSRFSSLVTETRHGLPW